MPFNPQVTTFAQVTDRLRKISKHLEKQSKFLASVDWRTVRRKENDDGSLPGNNPPKWPPS